MCKIKINSVLFLIVLEIFLVTAAAFEEKCKSDKQLEDMCGIQNYKTVKPLLDYFRQVRNELDDSEIKEKKLNELNSDVIEKYHELIRIHEKFMKEAALLDEYKNKVMKREIDLQLCQNKIEKLESKFYSQQNNFVILKGQLAGISTSLENCNLQVKTLTSQKSLHAHLLEENKSKLIKQDEEIQLCQSEIDTLNRTSENIREQQKKIELQLKDSQAKLIDKVNENQLCQSELDKLSPTSCIPFRDYSGIHQLNVSGVGLFDVLCDSQLAGPGWIVIQQRVGGNESFNRDWATYSKGFGAMDSDFFLGLEKIHRITSLERHELYIHLVAVNGSTYNARYDDFKVSDEDSGYKLSLGKFDGSIIGDAMRNGENMKFTTIDRDNGIGIANCALQYNGWWHTNCYKCNLNAPYGKQLFWWFHFYINLQEAKMLIRPKRSDE